jgi:hypothetical protein
MQSLLALSATTDILVVKDMRLRKLIAIREELQLSRYALSGSLSGGKY